MLRSRDDYAQYGTYEMKNEQADAFVSSLLAIEVEGNEEAEAAAEANDMKQKEREVSGRQTKQRKGAIETKSKK